MNSVINSTRRQVFRKFGQCTTFLNASLGSSNATAVRTFGATSDEGTHDDFKPQYKGNASPSIVNRIEEDINGHGVFVYMKGVPQAPMCGFSNMACRILDAYEIEYGSRDVLSDAELREGIKKYTHWPTIPQIFIAGEFVGGSDILMQMHQKGELQAALVKAQKPTE